MTKKQPRSNTVFEPELFEELEKAVVDEMLDNVSAGVRKAIRFWLKYKNIPKNKLNSMLDNYSK